MNGLDLFAGSGIGSLAFRHTIPNYRMCCYVENDPYCQAVLIARIKDGLLEDAPIWDDVRTFDGTKWRGKVDIVSGGFPCQPFSVAGQRQGETDKRNLWPDTARIIGEVRPRYAFLENVPGLLSSGYFETILCDLAKIGYDIEWDVVGASDVGANHRRKRLWILAYSINERLQKRSRRSRKEGTCGNGENRQAAAYDISTPPEPSVVANSRCRSTRTIQSKRQSQCGKQTHTGKGSQNVAQSDGWRQQVSEKQHSEQKKDTTDGDSQGRHLSRCSDEMANHDGQRQADIRGRNAIAKTAGKRATDSPGWWQVEPPVGRVAHGVAFRVDRLKMLGNGWVPQVVARILRPTGRNEADVDDVAG